MAIDQTLDASRWRTPLGATDHPLVGAEFQIGSLRDAAIAALLPWVATIEFGRPEAYFEPPSPYSFTGVVQTVSLEVFVGSIANQDESTLLSQIESRLSRELAETATGAMASGGLASNASPLGHNSIMAHFYPPAIFGERLKPSGFAEARARTYKARLNESLRTIVIGDIEVVVRRDGLVLARTTQYAKAHRIFETIFASASLLGLPFHSIGYAELAEARDDRESGRVNAWSYPLETLRTKQIEGLWNPWNVPISTRPVVPLDTLDDILNLAKSIYSKREARRDCILLSEASTSYRQGDHLQAFIWGWTLLERMLSRRWLGHMLGQNPPADKGRRDVAGDSSGWPIGSVLKGLRASGLLSEDDYRDLSSWQSKRNGVIHRGEVVPQLEAEKLLSFVAARVRESVGISPVQ